MNNSLADNNPYLPITACDHPAIKTVGGGGAGISQSHARDAADANYSSAKPGA